jgi:hypothetical protein
MHKAASCRPPAPVLALPLVAGLLGACSGKAEPPANVAAAPAEKQVLSPEQAAQAAVLRQLAAGSDVSFGAARLVTTNGEQIVCGRYRVPGQDEQRYISVDGEFTFVESQMEAGHMDQAFAEFCGNA